MVGSNAFGFEEVDGRAQARDRALPRSRQPTARSISPACSRTRSRSTAGGTPHRPRDPGRHRRDQGRLRPAGLSDRRRRAAPVPRAYAFLEECPRYLLRMPRVNNRADARFRRWVRACGFDRARAFSRMTRRISSSVKPSRSLTKRPGRPGPRHAASRNRRACARPRGCRVSSSRCRHRSTARPRRVRAASRSGRPTGTHGHCP